MKILLISLAVLAAAFLAALYGVYLKCFFQRRRARKTAADTDFTGSFAPFKQEAQALVAAVSAVEAEEVQCVSFDGLILTGRYYHLSDEAPLDIMAHGYRSCASIDFCGGFRLAREMGHNVLLIDQRACGGSEGRSITFGIKERRDLISWLTYAQCRFGEDKEMNLFGVSMGAATVLMAIDQGLPPCVRHIIADSPYNSPRDIIMNVAGEMGFPQWTWALVKLSARLFCRMDIEESSAMEAVKESPVPLLIFHGEADSLVPCDMSRAIAAAAPEGTRLVTIPGADHVAGMLVDPVGYRAAVTEFFDS